MRKVFLDYNSTTPLSEEVLETMYPFFKNEFGNPSSRHSYGQKAMQAVDKARLQVASLIKSRPDEVIFTGSGTEANNLAVQGIGLNRTSCQKHIITSTVEHSSVFNTFEELENKGIKVTYLPVDKNGLASADELKKSITSHTQLVSLCLANNETGTVNDIKKISEITKEKGIFLHTDAVQAAGKMLVNVEELGVDMLTVSGHKLYGPKGVGALYIRRGVKLQPLMNGGGQERRLRPGTENVPAIAGLGQACEMAVENLEENMNYLKLLRERLEKGIINTIPKAKINCSSAKRINNTSNISFSGEINEAMLVKLDLKGIAVSIGSACSSGSEEPSRILSAMGLPRSELYGSLRFSVGLNNTAEDIDYTIKILNEIIN
ncbi:MAG: cysteine desulfurase [Victivallales bacterium]|nr:cysteine desulfurase [Victivallales bacterium]